MEEGMSEESERRKFFERFAEPSDEFDEAWLEKFEETVIEEGEVVGTHSWISDNPGAGAGITYVYRFKELFFASTDFGLDGPYTKDLPRLPRLCNGDHREDLGGFQG